ncbi:hypothetical protein NS365_01085 [Aureimonas ureilytica]|uniref:Glycosyltransferase RgtA/B/C/D-like domain-containing protein n=1 Tax=Aureimonas ureilytica TaxID=401562 RepID=A0A147DCD1_9HYPH|nr:hypothetical protein [Aureimonas ureilytica]KTR08559.1 hypothetical protein NS365_01085 [Aureimonas ureilytica]
MWLKRANPVELALFTGWFILLLWVFSHTSALVPDEQIFLNLSHGYSLPEILLGPSKYGYGQLFWLIIHFCSGLTARAIAMAAMLTTPLLICATVSDRSVFGRTLVFLLWLSMPIAFWTGKLIGPELMSMGLASGAVFALHRERLMYAGLLSGLAVGLKLSGAPIIFFIGLLILLEKPNPLRSAINFCLCAIVGAFIAYPGLLFSEPTGVSTADVSLARVLTNLNMSRWEWDGVFSGGVLSFTLATGPFIGFMAFALFSYWRGALALVVAFVALILLMSTSETQYGWYVIPLVPAILYVAGRFVDSRSYAPSILAAIVGVNFASSAITTSDMLVQKHYQIEALENPQWSKCIQNNLSRLPNGTSLVNISEFGSDIMIPGNLKTLLSDKMNQADAVIVMRRLMVSDAIKETVKKFPFVLSCGEAYIFTREIN